MSDADDGAMFEVAPHTPTRRAPRARVGPLAFVLSQTAPPHGSWFVVDNSGDVKDPAAALEAMTASRARRQAVADQYRPERPVLFVAARDHELAQHGLTCNGLPLPKETT